jgi:uncharacterized protein YggE
MSHHMSRILWIIAALALAPVGAWAQSERPPIPSLRASGEATVTTKPDQAQLDLGVVTQAETAESAAVQNAHQLDGVLAALRQVLGPEAELHTVGYALRPNYYYPQTGGQPTITGYSATNVVQVKTGKLDAVGTIIDTVTRAGANTLQRLVFTRKDVEAMRAQALREAAIQARTKAGALAAALHLTIVRVLMVEEGGQGVRPVYARMERTLEAQAASAPTPVEPGTIDVHATVTLTLEVKPCMETECHATGPLPGDR